MCNAKHFVYNMQLFFAAICVTFKMELLLYARTKGRWIISLLFFILVCGLFPISGLEKATLSMIAPSVIWIVAFLSALLSLVGLFQSDWDEGRLEQLMLSPFPVSIFMSSKLVAHWCVTGLPIVCIAPLLGILFHIPIAGLWSLSLTLLLGTAILTTTGALVSTLTLGIHQGGALLMLCVLPLVVPIIIMGVSAVQQASMGLAWSGQCALLIALWIVTTLLGPFCMAAVVKIMAE